MIGDFIADMFGKSQSWFDRVARDQAEISALLAELNAIGSSLWDEIQGRIAGAIQSGTYVPVSRFTDFSWTQDDLLTQAKALLITGSEGWLFKSTTGRVPTDTEISTAEDRIRLYREMVEYAKSILPEVAARVQEEGDLQRQAMNAVGLRSPAEVGADTFYKELERRAAAVGGGIGVGIILAIGIGIALAFGGGR